MNWIRYDSEHRFIASSKRDICGFFSYFVSKEEAESSYKKLNKHYIFSRKISKKTINDIPSMNDDEFVETFMRSMDDKGMEILPYDGGAIRNELKHSADEYFFFSRLSEILGFDRHWIENLLLDDCHDNFFIQDDLSISASTVFCCLAFSIYIFIYYFFYFLLLTIN